MATAGDFVGWLFKTIASRIVGSIVMALLAGTSLGSLFVGLAPLTTFVTRMNRGQTAGAVGCAVVVGILTFLCLESMGSRSQASAPEPAGSAVSRAQPVLSPPPTTSTSTADAQDATQAFLDSDASQRIRINLRGVHPSGDGHLLIKDLVADGFGGSVDIAGGDNGTASVTFDNSPVTGGTGPAGAGKVNVRAGTGGPNGPGGNVHFDNSPIYGGTVTKYAPTVINNGTVIGQQVGDNNTMHVQAGPVPRTLSLSEGASLTKGIQSFRGTKINVFQYNLGDKEIADLADGIVGALKGAGWVVNEIVGTEMGDKRSTRPVPGILVEVRSPDDVQVQNAARALASALRSTTRDVVGPLPYDGFGRGGVQSQGDENPNASIQMTIGKNNR